MKILLVGGTGIISTAVAKKAVSAGMEVYTLSRGTKWRKDFAVNGTHMLYGDIRNRELCKELIKDMFFDVVIDFISFVPNDLRNKLEILKGKFKQYVFISTVGAYELLQNGRRIREKDATAGYNVEKKYWDVAIEQLAM